VAQRARARTAGRRTIAGGIEFHQSDVGRYVNRHETSGTRTIAHGVGSFLWMLGVFVAGTLFMLAFPAYSTRAAQWIGQEPLRSLGLGFVILVCLPVLVVLLLVTIIGIPLALIVLMLLHCCSSAGSLRRCSSATARLHAPRSVRPRAGSCSRCWRCTAMARGTGTVAGLGGAALLLGIGACVARLAAAARAAVPAWDRAR
jgi:hypothetical protein